MNAPHASQQRNRNRAMLIAIFAVFLGSFVIAGALRFSGWRPNGLKNHGELLQPPGDLREVVPLLADGSAYRWNPVERTWRIAVVPPGNCVEKCDKLLREIDIVWQLFGRDADRVHVLWAGVLPAGAMPSHALRQVQASPALRAGLPRVDDPRGVPVYVIDPNGFVILRYAPGFDPGDLRTDLSRLLKLQ